MNATIMQHKNEILKLQTDAKGAEIQKDKLKASISKLTVRYIARNEEYDLK